MILTKTVALAQLTDELRAAAIPLVGLTLSGTTLLRTLADGTTADLPPEAQPVVDAHVPASVESDAAKGDLAANYQAAVARLTDIVTNGGSYTAAQTRQAVLDMALIQKRTLRLLKDALT